RLSQPDRSLRLRLMATPVPPWNAGKRMSETSHGDDALAATVRALADRVLARGWTVATAESCTGGWIAKVLTDVAGSSAWFASGVVTYSNAAKQALLGVDDGVLRRHGAVSRESA